MRSGWEIDVGGNDKTRIIHMARNNNLEISLYLEEPNMLASIFPEGQYECVNLSLSGDIGAKDLDFLRGEEQVYIDEDESIGIKFINDRWKSIKLNLENLKIPCEAFNNLMGLDVVELTIANIQLKSEPITSISSQCDEVMANAVSSLSITPETQKIYRNSFSQFPNLKDYYVEEETHFTLVNGILFSKDKTILVSVPPGKNIETYSIPEGTIVISEYAFCGCRNLRKITIPKSVVRIEHDAFEACDNLEEIIVHPDNSFYYSKKGELYERIRDMIWMGTSEYRRLIKIPQAKIIPSGKAKFHYFDIDEIAPHALSGCKFFNEISIHMTTNIDYVIDNLPNLRVLSLACDRLPEIDYRNIEILNIIGVDYFDGIGMCSNKLREVNVESRFYYSVDGVVFSKNHELVFYPPMKENAVYELPSNTTIILDPDIFACSSFLEKLIINSSVKIRVKDELIPIQDYLNKGNTFELYDDERTLKIIIRN